MKLELRALGEMSEIATDLSSAVNRMKEMTHVNTKLPPPGVTDIALPNERLSTTTYANRTSPSEISVGLADDGST